MKKYCKGIREYIVDGKRVYDIIIIKWNEIYKWYDIYCIDGAFEKYVKFPSNIIGQWAKTIPAAKRKAMMDSGQCSKDFVWEEQ